MAIFRGIGGAGDSTTDATVTAVTEQATNAANSATAAASSASSASTSASNASTSATNAAASAAAASTSETNAAASEAAASASETAAAASETAAAASETAAAASETAAAASESAAATSETNAATSASSASTSATAAAASATAAASSASAAATSATNAAASASAASTSETNAATSESNAATSASSASTSASNASTSATNAASSASAAATSASNASTSETNAASSASAASTSETNAAASASAASTSETNAASSASAASTSASNAATSASNASTSETNASNSATAAASSATSAASSASSASTSASNAATSETNAATSETNAATSETNAATSATAAASSASAASTSASNASTSETNAASSESSASTSATNAATSATSAASSAASAASAQTAAESARDSALAAYDNFDDRYLGAKSSDPSLDNDGNALVAGALYFNTTSEIMKVYTGSTWVDAYAAGTTFLAKASNLSDLANAATARTNLGVAIGSDVQAYSSVLAATTASFTTAKDSKLSGIETGATADQTAGEIKTAYESNANTNAFTDAEKTKLSGVETGADVTDATNVAAAGAAMDSNFTSQGLMKRGATSGSYSIVTDNSTNWNTAYGWGDHASAGYLTSETYTGTVTSVSMTTPTGLTVTGSPVTSSGTLAVSLQTGYSIPTTTKQGQWDTAYGWGNHASAGYLTDITGENLGDLSNVTLTSPSNGQILKYNGSVWVNGTDAGGIALTDLSVGAEGTASGDGAIAYNNTSGVFTYTPPTAAGIGAATSAQGTLADSATQPGDNISTLTNDSGYVTPSSTATFTNKSGDISQWTNDSGYLTSETSHADVVVDGDFASQGLMKRGATAGSYSIVTDNSTNWNTAYGWGDHASAGYLTTETYTGTVTSVGATVPTGLSVSGSPITSSGTLAITFAAGYSIPTTTKQGQWDTAYSWGNHASAGYLTDITGESIKDLSDVYSAMSPTDGQLLTWDNANTRWAAQDAPVSLPSQTGNAGYLLTTDGTTASWTNTVNGGTY